MNLYLSKVPKREEINEKYLSEIFRSKAGKGEPVFKGHLGNNYFNFNLKNAYIPQSLERKFQFNFVVKSFNSLINNKKRNNTNSVKNNYKSHRLYLPVIKENNLIQNNNINHEEIKFNTPNSKNEKYNTDYFKNLQFSEIPDGKDEFSKNLLERSNSTISQSIINNNKSNTNSKFNNDNDKDKIIFRNLSHGSIFEAYKKHYLSFIKDYKEKSKFAQTVFKEKLEKIKNEKFKKSKDEELFKEYELKFNPERITKNLRKEFHFFQDDSVKRKIDEKEIKRKRLFNVIKMKEEKKNYLNEGKHKEMKPSQRIIQNMLRRQKKMELYEKSLINLSE